MKNDENIDVLKQRLAKAVEIFNEQNGSKLRRGYKKWR